MIGGILPRLRAALGCAVLLGAAAGPSAAQTTPADWLRKVHQAAQTETFSGSVVHQSAQGIRLARLHQAPSAAGPVVRMEAQASGDARDDIAEVIRQGPEIRAYIPHRKEVRVGQEGMVRPDFPQLFFGPVEDVLRHYSVVAHEGPVFVGRKTKVLQLTPTDGHRWALRCWVDAQTGLMVKQQVLGKAGEVMDEQAFSELTLGRQAKPRVAPHHHAAPGWTEVPMEMRRVYPLAGSPAVRPRFPLAGFSLSHVFASRESPLTQWVFTDGIASVSVFVEPRTPNRVEREMGHEGTTSMASHRHGNQQVLVLGDVPLAAAELIARDIVVSELRLPK